MNLRFSHGKGTALRALVAAGCLGAVLCALVLSSLPQLHEQIHGGSAGANHECAVTLLTSGSYQHSPTNSICVTRPGPPTSFIHLLAGARFLSAHLEFTLLEHAPPVVS
ncbi:MAG TPA: hypothetical protein VM940_06190 [Chthoniobacterales bacterium]|jgi:predicted metal-binding membrane protein|nr:hypothetical protein [Chthoniobacterales bacterium]